MRAVRTGTRSREGVAGGPDVSSVPRRVYERDAIQGAGQSRATSPAPRPEVFPFFGLSTRWIVVGAQTVASVDVASRYARLKTFRSRSANPAGSTKVGLLGRPLTEFH